MEPRVEFRFYTNEADDIISEAHMQCINEDGDLQELSNRIVALIENFFNEIESRNGGES